MAEANENPPPPTADDIGLEIEEDGQQQQTSKDDEDFLASIDIGGDKPKKEPNPLEKRLLADGWQKVDKHYEKSNDPNVYYTVKVSHTPNKAKVIFGYDLLGKTSNDELDNKVREAIRSSKHYRRSMTPRQKGSSYSVGFSVVYESPDEVFQHAEKLCDAVQNIIAAHLKTAVGNIKYIKANEAHSIRLEYQEQQREQKT